MNAVTIRAGGNIRVAVCQRCAMDTCPVGFIDRAVALGTSLRNGGTRFLQELTGAFVGQARLGVWIMAIGADGSIGVPRCDGALMDTIQFFFILFGVTFLAGGVKLQRKIAGCLRSLRGVETP